jgi:hypothetical protein
MVLPIVVIQLLTEIIFIIDLKKFLTICIDIILNTNKEFIKSIINLINLFVRKLLVCNYNTKII